MKRIVLALFVLFMVTPVFLTGCVEENSIYACTYEVRSTGCGGKGWSSWETECYEFNLDDYKEGWTPEKVCNKFSGSDTHCSGDCCIYVEYRNNRVIHGECPD